MAPEVLIVVLLAALLHAGWNAMAKGRQGTDPLLGAIVIAIGAAVAALPVLVVAGLPDAGSFGYVVASSIIHVGYFLLLGLGYRYADFSAIYPLVRGTAPLFTTGFAVLLLGERTSAMMLAGIATLSAGVLGLGAHALMRGHIGAPGLAVAAANICVVISYTLIDGVGARLSANPAGYVALMILGTGLMLLPIATWLRPGALTSALWRGKGVTLVGGAMVMASYGAALWAMMRAPIGAVAALRETSVLFGALIGAMFLGERLTLVRLTAAAAIVAGLALIRYAPAA